MYYDKNDGSVYVWLMFLGLLIVALIIANSVFTMGDLAVSGLLEALTDAM